MDNPYLTAEIVGGVVLIALWGFKLLEVFVLNKLDFFRPKINTNGLKKELDNVSLSLNRIEHLLREHDRRIMVLEVEHNSFHKLKKGE